jgi:hypothetical protein
MVTIYTQKFTKLQVELVRLLFQKQEISSINVEICTVKKILSKVDKYEYF